MIDKQIRVLQINTDLKKGGVQAEIMYPARILDKKRVHFDVMLLSDTAGYYEEEFSKYGNIYRIPLTRRKTRVGRVCAVFLNYFRVKKEMYSFFKSHEAYDAVHGHDMVYNAACMAAAKNAKVPVRIAYGAVNKPERKEFRDRLYFKFYLKVCALVLNRCCTHKFGVTQNAADYVFGKGKGKPIKNPTVDFEKFDSGKYLSAQDDNIHLLMVGSFSTRKNQKFAVDVLAELNKLDMNTTLTFVGYPRSAKETYLPELKEKVRDLKLEKYVEFLPQDANIPEVMARSSYLLIPSLQEGLPNVALEAQKMGMPCFVSSDVSEDCNCGICTFLPLDAGAKFWAKTIWEYTNLNGTEKQFVDMSEWDNRKVCEYYMDIWSGRK